ncbi:MAG TPA: thioredoxin domain-containing protein, partial [Gemmataceae bacterium]|nr:thioredoxin domain-containing protein [Gemmataceae bacterium]
MRRSPFAVVALLAAFAPLAGELPVISGSEGPPGKDRTANHLTRETSPYLLQHVHDLVDWYPWGPEAFAKARQDKKLVFLSVGYSSCHWCHVMQRQTFNDAEVAKLLNASFVCVKVDREERPDVDQLYQLAAQILLQGQPGGWPLSVFVTADGKPIAASGIFLPPEDRTVDGQRFTGLKSLIRAVLEVQRDHPDEIIKQAEQVARTANLALGRTSRAVGPEPRAYLVSSAVDALKEEFDPQYGGFGNPRLAFRGSKFPMCPALCFLLQQSERRNSAELLGMVTRTLDHMAAGGIYDQLGGGFHRYSTDRTWTVPHFEKMLSENAQLVELYAHAYERTKSPLYRRIVEETLEFVRRELTANDGGFYSALDADSAGEEGRFYVWTADELAAALPDRADVDLAREAFGIGGGPMVEDKYFVVTRPGADKAPDPRFEAVRQKLFAVRARRTPPSRDAKIVTALNGQMIGAYAAAGRALGQAKYTEAAARAADFILAHLRMTDGRLLRSFAAAPSQAPKATLAAYLDDYGFL